MINRTSSTESNKIKYLNPLSTEAAMFALRKYEEQLYETLVNDSYKDLSTSEIGFILGYAMAIHDRASKDDLLASKQRESRESKPTILDQIKTGKKLKDHQGLQKQDSSRWSTEKLQEFTKTDRIACLYFTSKHKLRTNRLLIPRLSSLVSKKSPYLKSEVQDCCNLILNEILEQVLVGKTVHLEKFGSFSLRYNKPRRVVNPFYGEFITEPSVSLVFSINRDLQRYIREHSPDILIYLNKFADSIENVDGTNVVEVVDSIE